MPRVRPRPEDTPATYVLREYAQAHGAAYQVPGVRVEAALGLTHREGRARGSLDLHLYSGGGQVRDLRGLKHALYRRDRTLFGRLMWELREALAPYAPVFTGLDATCGEEFILCGGDWFSMTAEAFLEASGREDEDLSERELVRWAERQGLPTPFDLGWKYPRTIWTDAERTWQPLAPRLEAVRDVPGVPEVAAVLAFVQGLPPGWAVERRWWRDGVHPGDVDVVICQAERARDPVLECCREMHSLLSEMEHEEPLVVLEVSDAQDHARSLAFVQACREVRARVGEMWAALGT